METQTPTLRERVTIRMAELRPPPEAGIVALLIWGALVCLFTQIITFMELAIAQRRQAGRGDAGVAWGYVGAAEIEPVELRPAWRMEGRLSVPDCGTIAPGTNAVCARRPRAPAPSVGVLAWDGGVFAAFSEKSVLPGGDTRVDFVTI